MIAGIQGSRMDDQRASVQVFPGLHHSRSLIGQFAVTRQQEDNVLDDQFFDMLMRCQVSL
jgi:G-protein signaling modulator 2